MTAEASGECLAAHAKGGRDRWARSRARAARRPHHRGHAEPIARIGPFAFREARRMRELGGRRPLAARRGRAASTRRGATVKPFEASCDAGLGARPGARPVTISPDPIWKGRILDALGAPIDGMAGRSAGQRQCRPSGSRPPPCAASGSRSPIKTGVRVIDLFTPLCAGQRVGIFAGSGIGKSTLLGDVRPLAAASIRRSSPWWASAAARSASSSRTCSEPTAAAADHRCLHRR